jgi:hypothetical protein
MNTIRVIAVLSIVGAAACVSSVERPAAVASDTAAQAVHESIAALHAAIPAGQPSAEVFEYSTVVPMPAPEKVTATDSRQYFDYN